MKRRIFGWLSKLIGIVVALAAVEGTAIIWLTIENDGSRMTDVTCRPRNCSSARKIPTAYFFHAIPGYGKTLTPEEKAAARNLSYVPLYRRMVESMLAQRESGMAVFDLGDLLVNVKKRVYLDAVHFRGARKQQ